MTDWGAPPTAAAIRAEIDSNSTQLALIVADTGELQTDWADGGRLDTLLDSAAADEWATDLPGTYTSGQAGYIIGTNIDGQISTIADTVGAGAYSVTVTVKSAAGSALEHASVWVSSDAAGATTVAGTLLTTAVGQVTFRLNTGTYYFWKQLAGHVFTNPESQTVDGTETFTFTATGTATAASDWKFSVTTLTAHLVGIVNQDYNADGTAPARFIRLVRDAAIDLWYTRDWRFRRKFGTLTTVASQAYAVMGTGLPSDFDKIDWKWLRETADSSNDTGVRIRFTEDSADLLAVRDKFSTTHGGAPPQVAFFVHDTSQDDFCWRVEFAPTPDKVYTYRLPYLKLDPWTLGDVGNDDFPSVPRWWFKLWEANAKWQIQQAFRLDKEWMDTKRDFEAALAACVENKQETVSSPPDTIDPGYADDPGLFGAEGTGTDPDWAPS